MKILDGPSLLAESGPNHYKAGSIFGALGDGAILAMFSRGRVMELADGEELFHAGDPGDSFFVVLQGQFNYFRACDTEEEVLLRSADFGEQLGYVSMIGLFERVGVGRAKGRTVVLEINADVFYQLHEDFPFDFGILMLNLSRDMARTIRILTFNLVEARGNHADA